MRAGSGPVGLQGRGRPTGSGSGVYGGAAGAAEGSGAREKKERDGEVKTPIGGPCLSGARRAHGPDARR